MIVLRSCALFAIVAPLLIALQLTTPYEFGYGFLFVALPIAPLFAVIVGSATLNGGWKRGRLPAEGRSTLETIAAWLSVFLPIHGGAAFLLVWTNTPLKGQWWFLLPSFVPVVMTALPILFAPPEKHPIRGDSWRTHA